MSLLWRIILAIFGAAGREQQRAATVEADARIIAAERDAPQDTIKQAEADARRGKF